MSRIAGGKGDDHTLDGEKDSPRIARFPSLRRGLREGPVILRWYVLRKNAERSIP
jgi:hypothetical protein